jgi:hypothetical protein
MYNVDDPAYLQARAIKKGTHKLHPVHQQLVDAVSARFGVRALDFTCETRKTGVGHRQQVVMIIVETLADLEKLKAENRVLIVLLIPYLISTDETVKRSDPLKRAVYPPTELPYPEIVPGCLALETIETIVVKKKAVDAILALNEKFPAELHSVVQYNDSQNIILFYHTDKQRAECDANGFTAMLRKTILQEMKKYDEFGYIGEHSLTVFTDSEEAFQRDYKGNWHYYFQ